MKKLLFICSKNKLRSPTAEAVFSEYEEFETDSAGLDRSAEVPLSTEAIAWADMIFVMEKSHKNKLSKNFQPFLKDKKIICLDIPDEYEYMESPETRTCHLGSEIQFLYADSRRSGLSSWLIC